jgi:predicted transcriptional regulator
MQDPSGIDPINDAVDNYIEVRAYQDALVHIGLKEMREGRVLCHEELVKCLEKTGHPSR